MVSLVVLTVLVHVGMAAVELPGLWGNRRRRGELWAVIILLLLGLGLAIPITLGYRPISLWKVAEVIFKPIGAPLLKPKGG